MVQGLKVSGTWPAHEGKWMGSEPQGSESLPLSGGRQDTLQAPRQQGKGVLGWRCPAHQTPSKVGLWRGVPGSSDQAASCQTACSRKGSDLGLR